MIVAMIVPTLRPQCGEKTFHGCPLLAHPFWVWRFRESGMTGTRRKPAPPPQLSARLRNRRRARLCRASTVAFGETNEREMPERRHGAAFEQVNILCPR